MASSLNLCPCGSGQSYQNCCGQYHSGIAVPETAEQLMRSRYTAYVNSNSSYLIDTLHPEKHTGNLGNELRESFKGIIWTGLQINELSDGGVDDEVGTVSFSAFYETSDGAFRMDENSLFTRVGGQWFYKESL